MHMQLTDCVQLHVDCDAVDPRDPALSDRVPKAALSERVTSVPVPNSRSFQRLRQEFGESTTVRSAPK